MTESVRNLLPVLIEDFHIKSILDAPCGDFSWMSKVNLRGINYVGVDIVKPLIVDLQKKYTCVDISFACLDITKDPLPKKRFGCDKRLPFPSFIPRYPFDFK
jgi:hypothetical protein